MKKKTFGLLDTLLKYLYDNRSNSIIMNDVINAFPEINPELVKDTLSHLRDNNLVAYRDSKSPEYLTVNITTNGVIEIEYDGFQNKHTRTLIERYLPIASIIISIIALVVAIVKD
ncbi:hypothetical protein [Flavobacterium anhuiense]|uniref:hypothetical protein n=1 Tax=Flavobacterium anhuiense TaxID=459526 RepID=UPI001182CE38|nr:hypothetical protein [Flavobacterium anhuiense]